MLDRSPGSPLRPPADRDAVSGVGRAAAAALALALAAPVVGGASAAPAAGPAGTIPLAECRLPHPAGLGSVPARCGTLEVPEDPATPAGPRIRLRVAVVPALDARERREPLFVVPGGPGQAATDFYAAYAGAFAAVQRTRDVVLVDQRGTGGSNRLDCEFPPDFEVTAPSPDVIRELSAACRRGLGGRPEFYTTSVAVRDLDAVRAALGHDRINLYGVSYGTRVVQHYARRFAARTRAIVLDGVVPAGVALGPDTPFDAQRALDLAFARCSRDPACDGAFPDLGPRFEALLARLAAKPEPLTLPDPATGEPRTFEFTELHLIGAVRLLNYSTATTAILPLLLDRAAKGDLRPLAAQLLMITGLLDEQLAYGMNAAVVCTEDVPRQGPVDRAAMAATYFGAQQLDALAALCEGWPRGVVDADLAAPLVSKVPALLLSGEADPVTTPAYGEQAAKGFADALHVIVPGQGHGQLPVGCAPRLVADFLAAGTARGLDAACLARAAPAPFFLDLSGPAP